MIVQCNAAEFDEQVKTVTTDNNSNSPSYIKKTFSKQEVFRLIPELLSRSSTAPGNNNQGVLTVLNLMQQNIDAMLFDGTTVNQPDLKPNSSLLSEIEQLIKNNSADSEHQAIEPDTIDIIKMMFDIIFEDDRLTDELKTLIARLQIPLLKVAILDKSYFSDATHPAEKLINKLTDAAVELRNKGKDSSTFYNEVSFIVSRVLNEFKDDASIFSDIMKTSALFKGDEKQGGNKPTVTAKSLQNLRETTEKLKNLAEKNSTMATTVQNKIGGQLKKSRPKLQNKPADKAAVKPSAAAKPAAKKKQPVNIGQLITKAINARVNESGIPDDIRDFLTSTWVKVATETYIRHGEKNETWKKTMRVVDQIAWVFKPKTSNMDKLRLSSMIPQLITNIQDGLTRTRQQSNNKSTIFRTLLTIHADNLKDQRLHKHG